MPRYGGGGIGGKGRIYYSAGTRGTFVQAVRMGSSHKGPASENLHHACMSYMNWQKVESETLQRVQAYR